MPCIFFRTEIEESDLAAREATAVRFPGQPGLTHAPFAGQSW